MSQYYESAIGDFADGMRVELHPATDLWMSGARYGSVVKVGRTKVHVQLDRIGRVRKISPDLLRAVS